MTQYKSKVDIVYEGLMDGIAKGAYQQGDRLVISQISKQWQVSDIPVREVKRLTNGLPVEVHTLSLIHI